MRRMSVIVTFTTAQKNHIVKNANETKFKTKM
jgi:hypothetical protein